MFTVLQANTGYHKVGDNNYKFRKTEDFTFSKIIGKGFKRPSDQCAFFNLVEEHIPETLEDAEELVRGWMFDPRKLIIRYKYTDSAKRAAESAVANTEDLPVYVRRASELEEVPNKLVVMDIDSLPLDGIRYNDLKGQVSKLREILHKCAPEYFPEDLGMMIKVSSSAGFSDMIKAHVFFMNNADLTQSQIKQLFFEVNGKFKQHYNSKITLVDLALYSTGQPHYFANPIFAKVSDPFKTSMRLLRCSGAPATIPQTIKSYSRNIKVDFSEDLMSNMIGTKAMPETVAQMIQVLDKWPVKVSGFRTKMIAAFHRAIQSSFDLKELENILRPIIERKRPGMSDDYIKQGRSASISKFVERSARSIPEGIDGVGLEKLDSGSKPIHLDLKEPPPANSLTFLKASLGTGKTFSVAQWLRTGQLKGNFLTITNSSSLVESNAVKFDAGDFRSPKARLDYATGKVTALSGTIHSLWKLESIADSFDVLFIDEADAVLNDLLYASIISEERKKLITNVLATLLRTTSRVIISDGDLSEETVRAYSSLIEHSRPLYSIIHHRKTLKGAVAYQHPSVDSLWGSLLAHLELGDKCLVVSDLSPDSLNEKRIALKHLAPGKNIFAIHANSKEDKVVRDIVNNTNAGLVRNNVHGLLCSPSITSGVDFNYFDVVFVITKSDNQAPNLRYQALRRDRGCQLIHYYFNNMKGYLTGFSKAANYKEGWKDMSQRELAIRREREAEYYINSFQYYLLSEGCGIEVISDPYDPLPDYSAEYLVQRINAIRTASENKVIENHNDAYEVQQKILLYYELDELDEGHILEFLENRPDKKAEFLDSIYDIAWPYLQCCTTDFLQPLVNFMDAEGYKFFLATGTQARKSKNYLKQVIKRCGAVPQEDGTYSFEKALKYLEIYRSLETKGDTNKITQEFELV